MTERGEVSFGDAQIKYRVVRSPRRRKTIEVTVDEPGLVTVAAPVDTSPEQLEATVRRRARWIIRHDGAASAAPPPRRFVSGESLPYLGRSVRLTVHPTDDARVRIRFHHWQFDVEVPRSLQGAERLEKVRAAFEAWYRERAAMKLPTARGPHREPSRCSPEGSPHPEPASSLGELRSGWDAPVQLARRHGSARPPRLRRRPRTRPPPHPWPHVGVLVRRRPGSTRLPPASRAPPGDRAPPQRLSYPPSTPREHLPTRPSRFPDRRLVGTGGRLCPSQDYGCGNSTGTKSKQFRSVFGKARPFTRGWPARGVRTARASV